MKLCRWVTGNKELTNICLMISVNMHWDKNPLKCWVHVDELKLGYSLYLCFIYVRITAYLISSPSNNNINTIHMFGCWAEQTSQNHLSRFLLRPYYSTMYIPIILICC